MVSIKGVITVHYGHVSCYYTMMMMFRRERG